MTTKEAFIRLISDKDYLNTLTLDERKAINSYKSKYRNGTLKFRYINTLLERHGYFVKKETEWAKRRVQL